MWLSSMLFEGCVVGMDILKEFCIADKDSKDVKSKNTDAQTEKT